MSQKREANLCVNFLKWLDLTRSFVSHLQHRFAILREWFKSENNRQHPL